MAVNQSAEEKTKSALIEQKLEPLCKALRAAGFVTYVQPFAARFDHGCGANLRCTSPEREHWTNHLRVKSHWDTSEPMKVRVRAAGQRTATMGGKSIAKIVERVQEDFEADKAQEQQRAKDYRTSQAWFDQACADFKGFEFCPALRTEGELRNRFDRLRTGFMREQVSGRYSPNIDCRQLEGLTAYQVMALSSFLGSLKTLRAPYVERGGSVDLGG